jgi:hypothetical protein
MELLENTAVRYALLAVFAVIAIMLAFVVHLGVRAVFRHAREVARAAGHRPRGAALRALVWMAAWAGLIGAFYLLAFYAGRRLGWWAVPPLAGALAATILCLLLADELLTARAGDVKRQAGIGATLLAVLGLLIAGFLAAI